MDAHRAHRNTLAAMDAKIPLVQHLERPKLPLRVGAPLTPQGAPLEKDQGTHTWAIIHIVFLYVEYQRFSFNHSGASAVCVCTLGLIPQPPFGREGFLSLLMSPVSVAMRQTQGEWGCRGVTPLPGGSGDSIPRKAIPSILPYISCSMVLLMISSCTSLHSSTKNALYPATRTTSSRYFSGCRWASSMVSLSR